MANFLFFILVGVATGATYSLSSIGVVLVYRSSGVINFATAATGMVGAYAWYEFHVNLGVPIWPAAVLGVIVSAIVGLLCYLLVMRPMASASNLMRIVATLSILIVLEAAATIRYGTDSVTVGKLLPQSTFTLNGLRVGQDHLILIIITLVITCGAWLFYRLTRFGLATSATSESSGCADPARLG